MTEWVDPGLWGVYPGFFDVAGVWHEASDEAVRVVLEKMGATASGPPAPLAVTVRTDHPLPSLGPGIVVLEDGTEIPASAGLPGGLASGYHSFVSDDGDVTPLVVSPGRAPCPSEHEWGFSVQLYASRSKRSWGIGDLGDLERIGRWAGGLGAGFTMVNPLHAPCPGAHVEPSPYYPGSRCFKNPLYIDVDALAVQDTTAALVSGVAEEARGFNSTRRIDHSRVWHAKSAALEAIFAAAGSFDSDRRLQDYIDAQGEGLAVYATFCALVESYGSDWRRWPAHLRDPAVAADLCAGGPAEFLRRVRYHSWLQYLLDGQLGGASAALGLVSDLAVGVDPNGADAWMYRGCFAEGTRVGAPPDEFNTLGQDWGLAPFDPWRLRSNGYLPWIRALRATFRHAKGIRVDHVMGLWRLYWIPEGHGAAEGVYVRYPHDDLLNILTLEAERAGALVVGEDLGTVEEGVREELSARQVLSYRLWWFEDAPSATWPEMAMGAVTTHDLPTVAGVYNGSDLQAQRSIGARPNEESSAHLAAKVRAVSGGGDAGIADSGGGGDGGAAGAVSAVYRDLGRSPCRLLTVTLDDVAVVEERPNMPGTTREQWPNWSLALPMPLEDLEDSPMAADIASSVSRK